MNNQSIIHLIWKNKKITSKDRVVFSLSSRATPDVFRLHPTLTGWLKAAKPLWSGGIYFKDEFFSLFTSGMLISGCKQLLTQKCWRQFGSLWWTMLRGYVLYCFMFLQQLCLLPAVMCWFEMPSNGLYSQSNLWIAMNMIITFVHFNLKIKKLIFHLINYPQWIC